MKKNTWVKALLGLFTVMLVTLLAACGSNNASSGNDGASKSGKTTTITFWHGMNGPYQTAINEIISDFNKSQSKYKVVGTAQGNYTALQQKIMAAAKSKSLPVIAQTTYTTVPDYSKQGFIESLDNYALKGSDKLTDADLKDIYPTFLTSSKYDGQYYSVPFSKSTRILYYNSDLMKKYNIKMPTSWEDIQKDGEKLKSKGVAAIGFDKSIDMELEGLARQAGNSLVAPKTLKANLDSKKTLEATTFLMDMINKGTAKTAGEDIYGDKNFTSGKTLFYVGSSAGVSHMKQGAPKDLNWGTAPLPTYKGKKATEIAGNDIVMFKSATADQKKAAWAFMKYLMSKPVTAKWAEKTGYLPLRKSALEDQSFQDYLKKDPTAKASVDSLDFGFQSTAFVGYSEYRNDLLETVDAMLTKHEAPAKAMGSLQDQTEKIIKENN
ncbi:ABC transporter substrate-binding protein [Lacticaseibacillus saniviri]|uniref:Sugar ABC transporter periplasmic component n=2 Tax=Lacticaseibacillus saniviri TaxID=931533 RepID=A0A0R2MSN9_9LACO|nr:ABC transporter substrate-binding protein [Lacticaseibacillus saniviri]KRO16596.1 sugar ABC transporter periplasmic component [Lacticaseibacillus saniviri JCM 17471 = DSM 24301]